MRPLITPGQEWTNHGDDANTSGTTTSVSLSGATNGDFVYVFFSTNGTAAASSLSCTTNGSGTVVTVQAQITFGSSTGSFGAWKIQKTASDTTLTISWTTSRGYGWIAQQWSDVLTDEGWNFRSITSAANSFTTNTATPTDTTRRGVGIFGGVNGGVGAHAAETWTPTAPMVEITHENGIVFAEAAIELCDTNGPVSSGAAQSYNSVSNNAGGVAMGNGFAAIFFLIPSPVAHQPSVALQAVNRAAVY